MILRTPSRTTRSVSATTASVPALPAVSSAMQRRMCGTFYESSLWRFLLWDQDCRTIGRHDANGERVIATIPTSRLPRTSLHGLR